MFGRQECCPSNLEPCTFCIEERGYWISCFSYNDDENIGIDNDIFQNYTQVQETIEIEASISSEEVARILNQAYSLSIQDQLLDISQLIRCSPQQFYKVQKWLKRSFDILIEKHKDLFKPLDFCKLKDPTKLKPHSTAKNNGRNDHYYKIVLNCLLQILREEHVQKFIEEYGRKPKNQKEVKQFIYQQVMGDSTCDKKNVQDLLTIKQTSTKTINKLRESVGNRSSVYDMLMVVIQDKKFVKEYYAQQRQQSIINDLNKNDQCKNSSIFNDASSETTASQDSNYPIEDPIILMTKKIKSTSTQDHCKLTDFHFEYALDKTLKFLEKHTKEYCQKKLSKKKECKLLATSIAKRQPIVQTANRYDKEDLFENN